MGLDWQLRTVHGTAERVRHTPSRLGGYVSDFHVGGARVRAVARPRAPVVDGDRVTVAGIDHLGVLLAMALANVTTGATWDYGAPLRRSGVALMVLGGLGWAGTLSWWVWQAGRPGGGGSLVLGMELLVITGLLGVWGRRVLHRGRRLREVAQGLSPDSPAGVGASAVAAPH